MSRQQRSDVMERVEPFAVAMSDPGSGLADMALAIARAIQPQIDPLDTDVLLDELAAAVPSPTRDGVMRFLFADGLFTANRRHYHDWRNSCLDIVVSERRGMPITLSIVGIEVARRLGIDLDGVGMPGHFLIGDASRPGWYADPFLGRTGLTAADAEEIYRTLGGRRWHAHFLQPTPDRLVIARVLNNLLASSTAADTDVLTALVMQLRQEMPEFADEYDAASRSLHVFN